MFILFLNKDISFYVIVEATLKLVLFIYMCIYIHRLNCGCVNLSQKESSVQEFQYKLVTVHKAA